MRVALIGAPAAGKSSVGRQLARRLRVPFVDVDQAIEASQGRLVADIFATDGEDAFRALEADATCEALAVEDAVVSLGGGAVMTPAVADALRVHPAVAWLVVSPSVAAARVGLSSTRPLLAGEAVEERVASLIEERGATYAELAHATFTTDGSSPAELVEALVDWLEDES